MSGCVGNVGFQLQRLVEDVVVHLRCVTAVERRLRRDKKELISILATTRSKDSKWRTLIISFYMENKSDKYYIFAIQCTAYLTIMVTCKNLLRGGCSFTVK